MFVRVVRKKYKIPLIKFDLSFASVISKIFEKLHPIKFLQSLVPGTRFVRSGKSYSQSPGSNLSCWKSPLRRIRQSKESKDFYFL